MRIGRMEFGRKDKVASKYDYVSDVANIKSELLSDVPSNAKVFLNAARKAVENVREKEGEDFREALRIAELALFEIKKIKEVEQNEAGKALKIEIEGFVAELKKLQPDEESNS